MGAAYHRPSASRRSAALATSAAPALLERLRVTDWMALAADLEWISSLTSSERLLAYCIELYKGKKHGFAVRDHAGAYDADAADRPWRRLESFFGETLA